MHGDGRHDRVVYWHTTELETDTRQSCGLAHDRVVDWHTTELWTGTRHSCELARDIVVDWHAENEGAKNPWSRAEVFVRCAKDNYNSCILYQHDEGSSHADI